MELKTLNTGNRNVFAFGDIHGCANELEVLIAHLETQRIIDPEDYFIFLGDYIDRGPNSFNVIETLIEFKYKYPNAFFLKGNHELMFQNFLSLSDAQEQVFFHNGGIETITSYEITSGMLPEEAVYKIPPLHFKFYAELLGIVETENFIFVHGGIDIEEPLQNQSENNCLWVRENFIEKEHNLNKIIVFGHTPFRDVIFDLPYKIGLDTGLVYGNKLSCLELNSNRIYQIFLGETKVVETKYQDQQILVA